MVHHVCSVRMQVDAELSITFSCSPGEGRRLANAVVDEVENLQVRRRGLLGFCALLLQRCCSRLWKRAGFCCFVSGVHICMYTQKKKKRASVCMYVFALEVDETRSPCSDVRLEVSNAC